MGFPFKLLDVAALGTVFFILFPLCPGCYSPGIEFLRAYTKRAEFVYAYMGIRGNDPHMFLAGKVADMLATCQPTAIFLGGKTCCAFDCTPNVRYSNRRDKRIGKKLCYRLHV
jgi:hypothetical protein